MLNILYAKRDFYYGFIDSSGVQISEQRKQSISDGFDILQNARALAKDGKIDDAYTQVKDFKEKNKLNIIKIVVIIDIKANIVNNNFVIFSTIYILFLLNIILLFIFFSFYLYKWNEALSRLRMLLP